MSVKTSTHVPKPDKPGWNRKWTDIAYKKYQMGMNCYRAKGEYVLPANIYFFYICF